MMFTTKVLCLLLSLLAVTQATDIVLKNGKTYSGEMISETGTHITLKNNRKKFTIRKSAIVRKDGKPFQAVMPLPRSEKMKPLAPEELTEKKEETRQKSKPSQPWVITLKNGTIFRGPRLSENKRIIVLESKGSPVSIFKNVIASIDSGNGGGVASAVPEKNENQNKHAVAPVHTAEMKIPSPVASKEMESVSKINPSPAETEGSRLTTVVVPKTRRGTNPRNVVDGAVPESTSDDKKNIPRNKKNEKKIVSSENNPKTRKKNGTSLASKVTVDVVSGDNRAKENPKPQPQSDASITPVATIQKNAILPRPKPRISVSSMSGTLDQPGEEVEANVEAGTMVTAAAGVSEKKVAEKKSDSKKSPSVAMAASDVHPVRRSTIITDKKTTPESFTESTSTGGNVQSVENKPRKKITEAASIVEIPAPKKKSVVRRKQVESTAERKRKPVVSGKKVAGKTAPVKNGGRVTAPVVAPPIVPVVTVVPPLGTSEQNGASVKKHKKKKTPQKTKTGKDTQAETTAPAVAEKPVLPQAPVPSPEVKKKRTDGKMVIVMNNGTEFTGTITSENSRFIVFTSDGAAVTIFKHLIKEVDGEPYIQKGKNAPARSIPKLTQGEKDADGKKRIAAQKRQRQDAFRMLPVVVLPETVDPGQLAQQIKNGATWKDRSTAVRNLGAMGQWATAEIRTVTDLLSDTAGGTAAAPLWIDSGNVKELLAPGLEAARALTRMGDDGETVLLKTAQERNPLLRRNAIFGLGYCYKTSARARVVEALGDSDPLVRQAALGGLQPKTSFQHLKKALEDRDAGVRDGAVVLLGKLQNEAMVAELLPLGKSRYAGVRAAIAKLLGEIGSGEGTDLLKKLCNDVDTDVRTAAVNALGKVRDSTIVPLLIEKLGDGNPGIRADVVEALGDFRDSRSIPALYSAVKDKNSIVRERAQLALKKHTEIPLLIEGLGDESEIVRENAAYILWLLTGQDNGEDKEKWEKWAAAKNADTSK